MEEDQNLNKLIKQEDGMEKPEENLEQPKETDIDTARLTEVNEQIQKKNEIIENTENELNKIRNELNMPPQSEIPPSIAIEKESMAKLNQEKSDLEQKNNFDASNQELQNESVKRFENNLRSAMDDISSKSKTMLDALYERQQQRLTPLQNQDEFQGMASHLKNLKNFDGKFDLDGLEQINLAIQKTSRLLENMRPQQTSQVRENPENLEKLAYGAKSFSASADEAGRNLGSELADEKLEEKRKELRKSLGILSEQAQKLNSLSAKMRSNFR